MTNHYDYHPVFPGSEAIHSAPITPTFELAFDFEALAIFFWL
jgi:hypothetical protein